jgi:hypothetical protein
MSYRDSTPLVCHSVTRGQDISCTRCGTTWSMDDDKPDCMTHGEYGDKVLSDLRVMLQSENNN